MIVSTLIENTSGSPSLLSEHGLSLYIETKDCRILFDTGATGAFADNAEKMGVDLSRVDLVVLSHGHNDHSGGLLRFFACNATAPVYLHRKALGVHYGAQGTYIGLEDEVKTSPRLRFVDGPVEIGEGLTLFPGETLPECIPIDSAGLTVLENGIRQPDRFAHEQYLLIREEGRQVLISGCSHRGIRNIVDHYRPDVLIGGFHFMRMDPQGAAVEEAARKLLEYPTMYYTGHCTGLEQYAAMKKIMADRLQYLSTGTVISV